MRFRPICVCQTDTSSRKNKKTDSQKCLNLIILGSWNSGFSLISIIVHFYQTVLHFNLHNCQAVLGLFISINKGSSDPHLEILWKTLGVTWKMPFCDQWHIHVFAQGQSCLIIRYFIKVCNIQYGCFTIS